jgi:hypothetical protein
MKQRQAEGQGLATACAALDEQVPPFQPWLETGFLHGGWSGEAAAVQGGQKGFAAAKGCEGACVQRFSRGACRTWLAKLRLPGLAQTNIISLHLEYREKYFSKHRSRTGNLFPRTAGKLSP